MFEVRTSSYALIRSSSSLTLSIPRTKRKTLMGRSLPVAGASEWNKLPSEVRDINSFNDFKKKLKMYLFKIAFNVKLMFLTNFLHYCSIFNCTALASMDTE